MIRQFLTTAAPTSVVIAALVGMANVSAEEKEPVDALLDCTISLVHNRKGDEHTLQQLAYMVQTAITEEVSESAVITYVNQCRNLEETLKDSPKAAKKEYLSWIKTLPNPKGTKKLLTGFVSPNHNCHSLGIHGGLDFLSRGIMGINLGVELAACESSLGHIWAEVRPYAETTTGLSLEQSRLGKHLRWGFHLGEEREDTAIPEKSPHRLHARASTDLQAIMGIHLGLLSRGKSNCVTYQTGLTFSPTPAVTFGFGVGTNLRFGLKSSEYEHLKRSVLEPSAYNLTFF